MAKYFKKLKFQWPRSKPVITNEMMLKKLKPGDHICSGRMKDTYKHHGIYVGDNRVIHLQGPHKVKKHSVACQECGHEPRREGTVVETCVNCFRVGHSLCICEYGIRVSEAVTDSWVSEKVNADGMIYTYRNGNVYLGIWTDNETVIHLTEPLGRWSCDDRSAVCQKCGFQPNKIHVRGGMVETCLECFLSGGLLFINEHRLHIAGSDTDTWISFQNDIRQSMPLERDIFGFESLVEVAGHLIFVHVGRWISDIKSILEAKYLAPVMTTNLDHSRNSSRSSCMNKFHQNFVHYFVKAISTTNPFHCAVKSMTRRVFGIKRPRSDIFLVYDNPRVQVYEYQSMKPADQVIYEARRHLEDQFGNYNLFGNNCEHFAVMCKTDVAMSSQVTTVKQWVLRGNARTQFPAGYNIILISTVNLFRKFLERDR